VTAVAVLSEARVAGLILRPDGDTLHVRPADRLTPDLRAKLQAIKPEVIELLTFRQKSAASAWSAAFLRLRPCGWPGREVIGRIRPALQREIDTAEAEAEAATTRYRSCEIESPALAITIERWERLVRKAAQECGALCHDCGRAAPAAAVDSTTGERFCVSCVRTGGAP
jgi:hypothetical protein